MTDKNLVEFVADAEDSEVPEPVSTGSAKRSADKTGGETEMPTLDTSKLGLPSKAVMISQMVAKAHRVSKGKLNDRMANIIAAMGSDDVADGSAESNRASVAMKEDVADLFVGNDLSEDFKSKATTILEAAVEARVIQETARLEEEFEAQLEEAIVAKSLELEEQIDSYLDAVIAEWKEENKIAIDSSLRTEVMESFLSGLKNLCVEHYIDFPEDKVDVVEGLVAKVTDAESATNDAINENIELKKKIAELESARVMESVTKGMTAVQAEKFAALASTVEFADSEDYSAKLETIKESFFKDDSKSGPTKTNLSEGKVVTVALTEEGSNAPAVDPTMARYVDSLRSTAPAR